MEARKPRYRPYFDEAGDPGYSGKSLEQNPYFFLVGVVVESSYYAVEFQPALERFKRNHLPYHPDDPPVLHRTDIIQKRGVFRGLASPEREVGFNNDLLELLRTLKYRIIAVVIDKAACLQAYGSAGINPYDFALAAMMARYSGLLNKVLYGVGDVMGEARYPGADRALSLAFDKIYLSGTTHVPGPSPFPANFVTAPLTSRKLKLKAKSANIAGLQFADILSYACGVDVLRGCGLKPTGKLGAFGEAILQAIQPKYNRRRWDNAVRGYGKVLVCPRR